MRRSLSKWGVLLGIFAGSLLLMATGAAAQDRPADLEAAMRADALHLNALEVQSDLSRLPEAARLHIQEAESRTPTDASAVDCLTLAAHLFYAAKRPMDARHAMEKAAERALSLGDVQRASMLYLNAAFAADREGNKDEMNRLGLRSEMLTASPLLNDEQRAELLRRIHRTNGAKTERARLAVRADSIHTEAVRMQNEEGRFTDAARMYKDEAKLRGRTDPTGVDVMLLASHLLVMANRPLEARRMLEDAGERALAAGDVERGARAFIEAAFVADKEGNKEEASRLGHRAETLSVSPQLTPAQRQEIARRIRRMPAT